MTTEDPHDLIRFILAQDNDYAPALAEIRSGRKRTHSEDPRGRVVGRYWATVGAGFFTHSVMTVLPCAWFGMTLSRWPFNRHSAVYRRRPRQRPLPFPLQIIRPLAS